MAWSEILRRATGARRVGTTLYTQPYTRPFTRIVPQYAQIMGRARSCKKEQTWKKRKNKIKKRKAMDLSPQPVQGSSCP